MTHDDDELDRLLARGRLGGPARDRILAGALARAAPRRRWPRRILWLAPALAAAAVLLLWLRPRDGGFRVRGGGGPSLEVACSDGRAGACPRGGTLVFRVDGAREGGYLAAWATPAAGGERIWYFPAADGSAPAVAAQAGAQVVPLGARLGPSQPPGDYQVHLLLARRPLARAEVDGAARDALAASVQRLTVTP